VTTWHRLEEIMRDVCADFEAGLAEFNGASQHVHLLVSFPPKMAVAKLVNSLKGGVQPPDGNRVPRTGPPLPGPNKLWAGSCFAGSVGGAPLAALQTYIDNQNRPT
jgi:putative transposase